MPKLLPQSEQAERLKIHQLRGNMNQVDRSQVFKKFSSSSSGVLFCTDVASRGLDLPNVDLVIQTVPPPLVEDYVHRVGRTARVGVPGRSILMLLPSEVRFIAYLQEQLSLNLTSFKVEDYFGCVKQLTFDRGNVHTDQEMVAQVQVSGSRFFSVLKLYSFSPSLFEAHFRGYRCC